MTGRSRHIFASTEIVTAALRLAPHLDRINSFERVCFERASPATSATDLRISRRISLFRYSRGQGNLTLATQVFQVRWVLSDGLMVFSRNDIDFAPSFTCRFDTNLHILSKGSQEIHQTFDREGASSVAHQCGDVRLFDPEDPSRFGLGEVTLPDKPVNL